MFYNILTNVPTGSCSAGSCDYFTGGYITQQYGSRDGGLTDAMQLETRFHLLIIYSLYSLERLQ